MADTGEKSYIAKESTLEAILSQLGSMPTKTDLESSLSSVGGGAVKHIQYGTGEFGSGDSVVNVTLSGFTDSSRMVAFVNGYRQGVGYFNQVGIPYVGGITTTKLSIHCDGVANGSGKAKFSYFVVEYN